MCNFHHHHSGSGFCLASLSKIFYLCVNINFESFTENMKQINSMIYLITFLFDFASGGEMLLSAKSTV